MIAFKSSKTLLLNLPMEYGLLRFSFWEIYGYFLSLSFTLTFKLFVMDTALKKNKKGLILDNMELKDEKVPDDYSTYIPESIHIS